HASVECATPGRPKTVAPVPAVANLDANVPLVSVPGLCDRSTMGRLAAILDQIAGVAGMAPHGL
ncbi:MAG: hypothetical protein ACKPKO_52345, partial [Candidatus Fonsibacter sp.]